MRTWTKEERYTPLDSPNDIRKLYETVSHSPYRQTYHIQPVTGLLNDPNGFLHYHGEWHLFYQWFPLGAVHGLKHWYHVSSPDLVTWKNLGMAVWPDRDYDNKGAYSGSALVTDDRLYLYYTGNHRDENWKRTSYTCLAELFEGSWRVNKKEQPLFAPHENYTEHQRDPKIIKLNDHRYELLLGAQNLDHQGRMIVYESENGLTDWTFRGEITVPGFMDFGDMWECPTIEKVSGYDVLLFCPQHITLSHRGGTQNHNGYLIGSMDWDQLVFTPIGQFHELDFGFDSYAAACAARRKEWSERTLIAWMGLPDAAYPTDEEDWSGCLTLPRVLRVRNRRLVQEPLPELTTLRTEEADPTPGILPSACEFDLYTQEEDLDLSLFSKEDHTGGIHITFDHRKKLLTVDRGGMTHTFNNEDGNVRTRLLTRPLDHLRIYIDHSSVEIFVNSGDAVFTSRVFPLPEEHHFELRTKVELHIWNLKPAVIDDFVV